MERYNDIRGLSYPFNLASIRSFSSPSPITMSTSCPLGIAFAVRPSAVAFSSTQPFSSCTKPFARQEQLVPEESLQRIEGDALLLEEV